MTNPENMTPDEFQALAKALEQYAKAQASKSRTARFIEVLAVLYRLLVVGIFGYLLYQGGTPWLIPAAVACLLLAPKSKPTP